MAGENPMRWKCNSDGCFNVKRRPKIELFAECFPRRINFGDVDGLVELNGRFCMLEWKGQGGSIHTGQKLSFEAFTRISGNVVFVVDGDAETMNVTQYRVFWRGKLEPAVAGGIDALKARIANWANWVQQQDWMAA